MVTRIDRQIPLAVPVVGEHEAESVRRCVESGWVSTAGPWVGRFERGVADYLGVAHAVATCNGTAALHIALLAAGVQPGDLVLVPDLTFIAPVNAIRYCGAEPVFVDVDADRWQMDPAAVREFLITQTVRNDGFFRERQSGRAIRAMLPVHLLGLPVPVDELRSLAGEFGLAFVQDAAQGFSGQYKGRKIGTLGGVTTFSFNGNKIVTCGAGGVVVTDDDDVARRAQYLTTQAKDDALFFRHDHVGFNYRLSSLNAALGLAQLERIDDFLATKRRIYARYREALAHRADLRWVEEAAGDRASYWLASFVMDGGRDRRDRVLRALIESGIQARPPWQANHTQQPYRRNLHGTITHSLAIVDTGLHLPSSVSLSDDDQGFVIDTLEKALGA
jgi:perosamine synthetase